MLGEHFTGTLVTDCYAGYEAHTAGAKQKCLAHLARTACDWQKLTTAGSNDFAFFEAIREFVQSGCRFHRLRKKGELTEAQQVTEKIWLRERLAQLITFPVRHEKALRLQKRILKHQHEWLVFLDDPRVPPTNNTAERALRPRSMTVKRFTAFGMLPSQPAASLKPISPFHSQHSPCFAPARRCAMHDSLAHHDDRRDKKQRAHMPVAFAHCQNSRHGMIGGRGTKLLHLLCQLIVNSHLFNTK